MHLFPISHGHTQHWIQLHVHLFQLFPQNKFSQVRTRGQMTFHFKTFVNLPNCPPEGHAILDFHWKSKLLWTLPHLLWRKPGSPLQAFLSMAAGRSLSALAPLGLEVSKMSSLLSTTSRQLSPASLKAECYGLYHPSMFVCCQHTPKEECAHDRTLSPSTKCHHSFPPAPMLYGGKYLHIVLWCHRKGPMWPWFSTGGKIPTSGGQGKGRE